MQNPKNAPDPMIGELIKKLNPEQKALFEQIIRDPKRMEELLNSPQGKKLQQTYRPKP